MSSPRTVEFYQVQLANLANGKIAVSMSATTVDDTEQPELSSSDIGHYQAADVDDGGAQADVKQHPNQRSRQCFGPRPAHRRLAAQDAPAARQRSRRAKGA